MGTGTIFMVQNGKVLEMTETEYESEDLLQELLATHPKLIPGDQIDSANPRKWLFIEREVGVPGEEKGANRWSLDHLFLDQDAVPTLIEVKRSSDTRIRREVVGQMLDYAANAVVYWPVENIRLSFEARCETEGSNPDDVLAEFLGDRDPDDFWKLVKTNLQAGRVRLLFVADVIPDELRRIVEFLNEQMDPADVMAVEVRQFVSGEVQTLVPQVYGASAAAQSRKSGGGRAKRKWDEDSILAEIKDQHGDVGDRVARRFVKWLHENCGHFDFGEGMITGSMYGYVVRDGQNHCPASLQTSGMITIEFHENSKRPPFSDRDLRLEYLKKLNAIPGVKIDEERVDSYPSIKFSVLDRGSNLKKFLEVLDWYAEKVKRWSGESSTASPEE